MITRATTRCYAGQRDGVYRPPKTWCPRLWLATERQVRVLVGDELSVKAGYLRNTGAEKDLSSIKAAEHALFRVQLPIALAYLAKCRRIG